MKLWYSPASPFVRKVMITAHETGQIAKIKLVEANTSVVNRNPKLVAENPTGKIPTLVLNDGTALHDSRVICAYLDSLHRGKKLVPDKGIAKFRVMTLESLGNAIMDAAVLARYEMVLRPEDKRWKEWLEGQMAKVVSGLDALERIWVRTLNGPLNVGAISVAAALGYLDFRFDSLEWRKKRPGLAAWFAKFSARPSMQATAPKA
jgi:glutathione S-transferase